MCGIAGYSLGTGSAVDRTLAAQALLAGIAERGADAVGYAYRYRGETFVHKQRSGASELIDLIEIP
jgi:asparagine synthetase B (glutamine-hydrolysing)